MFAKYNRNKFEQSWFTVTWQNLTTITYTLICVNLSVLFLLLCGTLALQLQNINYIDWIKIFLNQGRSILSQV